MHDRIDRMKKIFGITFTILLVLMTTQAVLASSEAGLGLGFNPEGREEATGDSFVYYGYKFSLTSKLDLGVRAHFRNFGATLSESSYYQDRIAGLLIGLRYYVSDIFYLGAALGPQWKIRSTITFNSGYYKERETYFEFGYIPKPEIGTRLWIDESKGTAVDWNLSMSNKGEDILTSIGVQF